MPGVVSAVSVGTGENVGPGDPLLVIEAMKVEMVVRSAQEGRISEIITPVGANVNTDELLIVLDIGE
jgi:biotin carboxyl carrier protein